MDSADARTQLVDRQEGGMMTFCFRLYVLVVCAVALQSAARAGEQFPGQQSLIQPLLPDQTHAGRTAPFQERSSAAQIQQGTTILTGRRMGASTQVPTPPISAADVFELTSWARTQIESGTLNNQQLQFTADDLQALEAWARTFNRRSSTIKDVQSTAATAPGQTFQKILQLAGSAPAGAPTPAPAPAAETAAATAPSAPANSKARPTNPQGSEYDSEIGIGNYEYDSEIGIGNYLYRDLWAGCNAWCQAGIIGGVERLYLAPIDEPTQQVTLTDLATGSSRTGSSDPGLGSGVRAWLGLEQNGTGFRVRYTYFDDAHVDPSPIVPINTDFGFNEESFLKAETLDVELTRRFCFGSWILDTSFGGRYAHLERHAKVVGYGTLGDDVDVVGLAIGANEVKGAGLTVSIGGRKPITHCGWNVFWNFRGSSLWCDDALASALTDANVVTDPALVVASAHSRDQAFATKDNEDVFISELQLGLEYERCLQCLPAKLFFRAAFEYHHWEIGDIQARSNSFAFLQGGPPNFGARVDADAQADNADLDLIGFVLAMGLRY